MSILSDVKYLTNLPVNLPSILPFDPHTSSSSISHAVHVILYSVVSLGFKDTVEREVALSPVVLALFGVRC